MKATLFLPAVTLVSLLASACNTTLTAPYPVSKAMHFVADAGLLTECGRVVLSANATPDQSLLYFRLVVPDPASTAADAPHPYHLDLKANGYARTRLAPDEYTFNSVYATSVVMKRPGAYVFKGALANTSVYPVYATCTATGKVSLITVTARTTVSTASTDAPVVFQVTKTSSGDLTAQLKEYPLGSTPDQLGLP